MTDSPLVNNVLCFISTARHLQTHNDIISMCQTYYKADKLSEAKVLLAESCSEKITNRKGDNRMKNDITDILLI